jgi:hypothetical protein
MENPKQIKTKREGHAVLRMILEKNSKAGRQWFTTVILATQEAEIRRITVQIQPRQTLQKNRAGGVAQGEDPEFKPQNQKKENCRINLPLFQKLCGRLR